MRVEASRRTGAQGATFVLREDDRCFYADEDAIAPLWKGQRFPIATCISGWAMLHDETAVVPDITVDERIPLEAYLPTFVRSLVMVPVGSPTPVAAIGAHWSHHYHATPDEIAACGLWPPRPRPRSTASASTTLPGRPRSASTSAGGEETSSGVSTTVAPELGRGLDHAKRSERGVIVGAAWRSSPARPAARPPHPGHAREPPGHAAARSARLGERSAQFADQREVRDGGVVGTVTPRSATSARTRLRQLGAHGGPGLRTQQLVELTAADRLPDGELQGDMQEVERRLGVLDERAGVADLPADDGGDANGYAVGGEDLLTGHA